VRVDSLVVLGCKSLSRECAHKAAATLEDVLSHLQRTFYFPMHNLISLEIRFPASSCEEEGPGPSHSLGGSGGDDAGDGGDGAGDNDVVTLDLGDGIILTSKRVLVDLFCDDDNVDAQGTRQDAAAGVGKGLGRPETGGAGGMDDVAAGRGLGGAGESGGEGNGDLATARATVYKLALGSVMEMTCMLTNNFPLELTGVSVEVVLRDKAAAGSSAAMPRGDGVDARVADALDILLLPEAVQGGGGGGGDGGEAGDWGIDGAGVDASGEVLLVANGLKLRPGLNRVAVRGLLAKAGDFTVDRIDVRYGKLVLVEALGLVYGHCVLRVRSEKAPVELALLPRGRVVRGLGGLVRASVVILEAVAECRARLVLPPPLTLASKCVLLLHEDTAGNETNSRDRRADRAEVGGVEGYQALKFEKDSVTDLLHADIAARALAGCNGAYNTIVIIYLRVLIYTSHENMPSYL
jgi:hypothetical protein